MPLTTFVGELPAVVVGSIIFMVSCVFLGAPPALFPEMVVSDWLPYVVTIARTLGLAIASVGVMAVPMKACVNVKIPAEEAAAPLGAFQVLAAYGGMTFGPLTAGPLIDAVGVGGMALVHLGLMAVTTALVLVFCYPVMSVGPAPAEDGASSASSNGDAASKSE